MEEAAKRRKIDMEETARQRQLDMEEAARQRQLDIEADNFKARQTTRHRGHQCRHQSEGGGPCDHERGLVEDERQDEGLVRGQAEGNVRRRRPELGRPIGRGRFFGR